MSTKEQLLKDGAVFREAAHETGRLLQTLCKATNSS